MNSLALLSERAETRKKRRKSLAEIYAAMSDLRAAANGTAPATDAAPTVNDGTPEGVRRLIGEARTLAIGLAAEQRDMQQLQNDLGKARGLARARALILVVIALILAPIAVLQLW
jgi:hypothetical protein